MSDRGVHPLVWLGLGAAGVWGASHYLAPMLAHPNAKKGSAPATGAPPAASASAPATTALASPASPRTVAAPPPEGLSRAFDPIFGAFAFGRRIPVAYLRALAWSESRLRSEIDRGLFQIASITRDEFARRQKLEPAALDLNNPMTNTAIAVDTLATIKASLAKNHPRQVNAIENWSNPLFVELLSLAWNAGWSEARGVGRVLAYLDERGVFDATIHDIAKHARAAGAVSWLYAYPERIRYASAVEARFTAERDRDAREKVSAFYQAAIKPKAVT